MCRLMTPWCEMQMCWCLEIAKCRASAKQRKTPRMRALAATCEHTSEVSSGCLDIMRGRRL